MILKRVSKLVHISLQHLSYCQIQSNHLHLYTEHEKVMKNGDLSNLVTDSNLSKLVR